LPDLKLYSIMFISVVYLKGNIWNADRCMHKVYTILLRKNRKNFISNGWKIDKELWVLHTMDYYIMSIRNDIHKVTWDYRISRKYFWSMFNKNWAEKRLKVKRSRKY